MKPWEYATLSLAYGDGPSFDFETQYGHTSLVGSFIEVCNILGGNSWELIGFHFGKWLFKRELPAS